MVRNRLDELQAASKHAQITEEEEMKPLNQDKEKKAKAIMKAKKKGDKDFDPEDFEDFLERFEEVVGKIDKVKANVAEIRTLQKAILTSTRQDEQKEARMNDLIAENKKFGKKIRDVIKKEQDFLEKKFTSPKKMTQQRQMDMRMRRTQVAAQSKRFYDIWTEYNNGQVEYRDKSKKLLVKRCKITNNSLTDDQIENMLDEGNTAVFARSILDEERLARQQLSELQDRHDELLKLEKSIREVHEMFMEIANLVSQQGEMIDNITIHVDRATYDVEQGKGHLGKAEGYAVAARKKKICLGVFLLVVVLIVVIVIVAEFGGFTSSGSVDKEVVYVYVTPSTTTTTTSSTTTAASLPPTVPTTPTPATAAP